MSIERQYASASETIHRLKQELVAETARADAAERRERDMRRELDRVRERLRRAEA